MRTPLHPAALASVPYGIVLVRVRVQKGLGGVLACWAVRRSKCHRFVTGAVDREVSRMAAEPMVDKARSASAAGEDSPLFGRGFADMAAVGAPGDDDGD